MEISLRYLSNIFPDSRGVATPWRTYLIALLSNNAHRGHVDPDLWFTPVAENPTVEHLITFRASTFATTAVKVEEWWVSLYLVM
ncbi:hypothetical protein BD289DRAFT_484080 [Coniella lustricola]|uniref:Uncharacterized protein n=1 Tax=Coniella lustricola TaxID=2025994 RepID=A0A2T3A390_9PEZI|nr:hypothetical protein BD289DRAFT_484080 [Coniella lustricola]